MDHLRILSIDNVVPTTSCSNCPESQRPWDRIAGRPYCPRCLEALALGEAAPLALKTEKRYCAVCHQTGTVRFMTFPLQSQQAVEVDLCGEHLRAIIGRRLGPHAFEQLRRLLSSQGVLVGQIFLLHGAFYDSHGRALHPAKEAA